MILGEDYDLPGVGIDLLEGRPLVGSQPLRLVRNEALERRADVGFGDMDVISLADSRGAVPHQLGQGVPIHAALHAPSPESVAPAIERKGVQPCFPDRPAMRFLDTYQMSRIPWTREHPALPARLHP